MRPRRGPAARTSGPRCPWGSPPGVVSIPAGSPRPFLPSLPLIYMLIVSGKSSLIGRISQSKRIVSQAELNSGFSVFPWRNRQTVLFYGCIGNAPHRVSGYVSKGKLFSLLTLACLICSNAEPRSRRLNLPSLKLENTRRKDFQLIFGRLRNTTQNLPGND